MSDAGWGRGPKVTLVVYGFVRKTHVGADDAAWMLAEHLHERGRLARVLCCRFDVGDGAIPAERFAIPPLFAGASRTLERLSRVAPSIGRRHREQLFDWLVSRSPELGEAEVVVFRKPNFPRTAHKLSRRGTPTLAIATICHPRLNYDRVGHEAARLGIVDRSPYRDVRRVEQIERFFGDCDRLLTTEVVGEESFARYGIGRERIVTTKGLNGADCERFTPREKPRESGPLRFLHLSAMGLIKGVGRLFEAWRDLAPDDAELVLAGTMDESAKRAHERIAPPRTVLLGPVEDSPVCYRDADVFVSPSLADSGPFTVLEALASGLPAIVSDACGASRLIRDGVDGFVYPWNDTGALRERLRWCLEHPGELAAMGQAARATALANPRGRFPETVLEVVDRQLG